MTEHEQSLISAGQIGGALRVPQIDDRARRVDPRKLAPPIRIDSINRPALLSRVDCAIAKRVAVMSAPYGYGKTTLLAQWYQQAKPTRDVVWLTLDSGDRKTTQLVASLARALGTRANLPSVLDALSNRTAKTSGAPVIVLDQLEALIDSPSARLLDELMQRASPRIRWLIGARGIPDLSLSLYRLDGGLEIIRADELRCDAETLASLTASMLSTPLDHDATAAIAECEGWIAGIKLALLTIFDGTCNNLQQRIEAEIDGYFATVVWPRLRPSLREFVLMIACTDEICGSLANQLTASHDADQRLTLLHRSQLFIDSAARPQWLRLHPCFRSFLRRKAQRECPGLLSSWHERASRWFAEHHEPELALDHAFRAGDRSWCVELIGRCVRTWLKTGEFEPVLRWTQTLTREEVLGNDAIATSYIASMIFRRRFAEAASWLRAAETSLPAHANDRLHTLRLMLAALSQSASDEQLFHDSLERGPCASYLSGTLMTLQSYALLRANRFDAAKRRAISAREMLSQRGNIYGVTYADVLIMLAQRASGEFAGSAATCEQLYRLVEHGARNPAWVNAAAALGSLRYEQNRLDEAGALCNDVLPLVSSVSTPEIFAGTYITLARVKAATGNLSEALHLLAQLHSALEDGHQQRLLATTWYERVRTLLLAGETHAAQQLARESPVAQLAERGAWDKACAYEPTWDRLGQLHAMLLLTEQRFDDCRQVVNTLVRSASQAGCVVRVIGLEALATMCEWRTGQREAAFLALNRALARTRAVAFTRSVFDEAAGIGAVLAAATRECKLQYPLPIGYLSVWGALINDGEAGYLDCRLNGTSVQIEKLTEREVAVLVLLAQGLSNEAIASRCCIALSTTKWHLKNIFAKLGVTSRTHALARARGMRLIA